MTKKAWGLIESHWSIGVNIFAGMVSVLVLATGLWTIVGPSLTTTLPGSETTTRTTKTTTEGPKVTTEASTVTATGSTGLIERFVVGNHMTALIGLGISVLIAFLAGALVQRVLRARYGMTVGPLTLPELAEAAETSAVALEGLSTGLKKQGEVTQTALEQAAEAMAASAKALREVQELRKSIQ